MQNFNICDINSDDKLSLDEFKGFLYPHYYDHTHVIHVANNIRWVEQFKTSDVGDKVYPKIVINILVINLRYRLTYYVFRVFDKDTDGVISKQEFIDELKRYSIILLCIQSTDYQ